jgi:hypothetical protein
MKFFLIQIYFEIPPFIPYYVKNSNSYMIPVCIFGKGFP